MKYDVVIAGAGLAGLTLACLLRDRDIAVALVEGRAPSSEPRGDDYDLRVSAITPASRLLLERAGAWQALDAARIGRIEKMRVWEDPTRTLHFEADEVGIAELSYIVENRALTNALWARARQAGNITVHCPAEISRVHVDQSSVQIETGTGTMQARALIGADGVHSRVRAQAGIALHGWDYVQDAIVAHVRARVPHRDTAWQRFLPSGPLAFLPMPEADLSSIVWSCSRDRARALMALDEPAFVDELHATFGDALGELRMASERTSFPLAGGYAREYVRHRIALLGDAAHRVHPLAGQGANLGFGDAGALADILMSAIDTRHDAGDYSILRRYERSRKEANLAMLAVTDGLYRLFSTHHTAPRVLGSWGLTLVDKLPAIKHALIRQAMGVRGI